MQQLRSFFLSNFRKLGLAKSQDLQKIFNNVGWLVFDRMIRMGVGLFVGSWVARYLGPTQYGDYNYAIAVISLFAPLSTLGLDSTVIREIVDSPKKKEQLVNTALLVKLVAGLITIALIFVWVHYFKPYSPALSYLILISSISFLIRPLDAIDFYFQAITNSKFTVKARSAAFFCGSASKVILIKLGSSVIGIMLADLLETFLGGIGLWFTYQQQGHRLNILKFDSDALHRLLSDSWPLIISGSLVMIYMRIDQIMIGNLLGSRETGIYAAAVRIAEVSYFLPLAIVSSIFPRIIEKRRSGEEGFKESLQKLYTILIVISYATSLFLTLFSSTIVSKIYGSNYLEATSSLAVLSWSCMWVSLGVARSSFLTAINRNILHLRSIIFATVINVGLNYILIPKIGILGAGIATNVSYCFAAYISCFLYKELRETGRMMTQSILLSEV